jgi:hypothetical protein
MNDYEHDKNQLNTILITKVITYNHLRREYDGNRDNLTKWGLSLQQNIFDVSTIQIYQLWD